MKLLIIACFVALACASPVYLKKKTESHASPDYMNFKCEGIKDGFYADRANGCRKYFECQDGAMIKRECEGDYIFNEALWACDLPSLYTCPSVSKRSLDLAKKTPSHGAPDWLNFKCDGLEPGFYADLMRGCHQFYYCSKDGAKSTHFCQDGTIFNAALNACYSTSTYSCPSPDEKREEAIPEQVALNCANKKDGYYPAVGCDGYHRCVEGQTLDFPCAPGTLFDRKYNTCNHADLVTVSAGGRKRYCSSEPVEKRDNIRAEEKLEKLRELLREMKNIK